MLATSGVTSSAVIKQSALFGICEAGCPVGDLGISDQCGCPFRVCELTRLSKNNVASGFVCNCHEGKSVGTEPLGQFRADPRRYVDAAELIGLSSAEFDVSALMPTCIIPVCRSDGFSRTTKSGCRLRRDASSAVP